MKKTIFFVLLMVAVVTVVVKATSYRNLDFVAQSGNTLIVYGGTSANTWKTDDAYNTNRTYVTGTGTTVIPLSTNANGTINPGFGASLQWWAGVNGETMSNVLFSVTMTGDGNNDGALTFYFARSVDGTAWDTNAANLYSFSITPNTTKNTTTVPLPGTAFVQGAGYVELYKIISGTNTAVGKVTINNISVGAWIP